jgi:diketogulonate reductase-like aldo/keto reductase
MGAEQIVLMGRHADRTDLGAGFGATDIVLVPGEEGVEEVRNLTGGHGVDAVLECVGSMQTLTTGSSTAPSAWTACPTATGPWPAASPSKSSSLRDCACPEARMTMSLTLNNGVQMPALGFGVFQTPPDVTAQAVGTALATGYRLIDTAAAYGNEREVGQAIRHSGVARDDVFIETKIWISDYGYDQTLHAFDKSADGRVQAIGVSNFMPGHLDALLGQATVVPAVNQVEVHPYFAQPGVQAADAAHGILTQAWSPIGGITSYRGTGTSTFDDPAIASIAAAHGKTPAQVMIRWHLQEGRSAIPKSVRPERIAENFDVFDFELTTAELKDLDALDTGVRGGPEPDDITLEAYGRPIPEA